MAWLTAPGQSIPQEVYQVAQDHQLGAPLREYQGVNPIGANLRGGDEGDKVGSRLVCCGNDH
jgi:hypothetical protein